ncbi:MAG TPA: 50S ribosomal protein L5 [Candidatus Saccharimonadia bacterium]|jgi:large subunit ribosomal protein L5|nr:50S ribosomal protein L5 [Candidatus Saccharimonadia bacterium]
MNRFKDKYNTVAVPALKEEFKYTNVHQVPRLVKVVVSAGVGRAVSDTKHLDDAADTLAKITGQHPVTTVARKSIASFKVREGNKVGTTVTLRGLRAEEFLDQLTSIVLPRIRDFHGISDTAFDPHGNYSLGLPDHSIFPQIPFEEVGTTHGLQVNVVTSAKTPAEGKRFLELMGFPFRRNA